MRQPSRARHASVLAASCLALTLAACGGDGPADAPRPPSDKVLIERAVRGWYGALAQRDGAGVCSLMTPAGRKRDLAGGAGPKLQADGTVVEKAAACPAMAEDLARRLAAGGLAPDLAAVTVSAVHVLDAEATATATFGQRHQSLVLRKVGPRWLIDGVQA